MGWSFILTKEYAYHWYHVHHDVLYHNEDMVGRNNILQFCTAGLIVPRQIRCILLSYNEGTIEWTC